MKTKRFTSILKFGIRQKVLLVLLTVVLTSLAIIGWMSYKEEQQNTLKQIEQRGNDISRFVAKSLAFSVIGYDYHTIQLLLDEIVISEEINYAKVVNLKGNTMGESGSLTDPQDIVQFSQEIRIDNQLVGTLSIGFSTANTFAQFKQRQFTLLKRESLIILLIAIAEFIALSLIIIRPVTHMSEILENSIDVNGRVIAKVPVVSNDEFGQLAERFNRLGMQLNTANERLQSKIQTADQELIEKNEQLIIQSEELKRINLEFQRLAITDALTGLYNRRHFEDMLENEMELANRYGDINSLLVIDLDFFKRVNDSYGHPCGDHVLKEVAIILRECFRKNDILCRVGGEEFVAICRRAGKNNAKKIAEKLRRTIEHSVFLFGENKIKITTSIGVATSCPGDAKNGSLCLYRRADAAVYHSKQHGRNRVSHYDEMESAEPRLRA